MRAVIWAACAVCLAFSACDVAAYAETITFDAYVNSSAGNSEVSGNEWIAQGIVFSTPDLALNLGGTTGSSPNSLGADKSSVNDFDGQLNFEFTGGQVATDLSFIIFNTPFTAKAYDASNTLVHMISSGASFTQTFDFTGFSVNRVEITGSFYAIDDVTYTLGAPVPEPGTLALLGLGVAGLALGRRRKKARAV